jgi:SAM-dependent methyltransferase
VDADGFRRASLARWEAMAPGWEARHAWFEEATRPVTERMLDRLAPGRGPSLLELAAGTGLTGFAAAARIGSAGHVIVSDHSPAMVEAASRRAAELGLTNVECRVLDAERIDLPDASVEGVLCRWGYPLVVDPARALAETRRVLPRGGRVAAAVFSAAKDNPWAAVPLGLLAERGHPAVGPGPFSLADRALLTDLFGDAGFRQPSIEEVATTWRFTGLDDYWSFLTEAVGAVAMVLARLTDAERDAFRAEIAARLPPSGPIELPARSLVVSGYAR